MPQRVALIGLDCGTPQLAFDRFAADMPTLTRLREDAAWGPMRSVVPPITVPAWACMMSGRTPGELGVYGFRDRRDHDYGSLAFASSDKFTLPRLWDVLSGQNRRSVVLGVPGTYPPAPIHGEMVSCFMAPSTDADFTYPRELRDEVQEVTGGYQLDVDNFRSPELARISQQIFDMSEQRFTLAGHLARTREWDFFSFVDMGPDRLHHGFWRYCDPEHPRYEPGNQWEHVFRDYYRALDAHLATFLEGLPDDTAVLVVSDHGGQPMVGGFCVNEWLRQQGLLVLAEEPTGPTRMSDAKVDWSRTTAWAEGGYYGRIFLNVAGREPQGTVPARDVESTLDQVAAAIEAIVDEDGQPMGNRAMRPADVYPEVRAIPPDLIVYFGDLRWRALATLGLGRGLYSPDNDTGPDHANHAEQGIFVLAGTDRDPGPREGLSLYDVAPTLQDLLGLPRQPGQRGVVVE
ncbi:alkaline phosphatase family protein [Actinophytocola sp.]|uniref:alkaline phosphatase family protein n=1 Tax=Actinophytocola sp. TaxID=1872138 RepID=UPI002ED2F3E3